MNIEEEIIKLKQSQHEIRMTVNIQTEVLKKIEAWLSNYIETPLSDLRDEITTITSLEKR